ncbi:hypothetical protein HG531_010821 [Fusarium graminearum]|nr:hypothetical protein HG531_010821 [Fusarium graminearum]
MRIPSIAPSGGQDLAPHDVINAQTSLLETLGHVLTIRSKRVIVLVGLAGEQTLDANAGGQLDVHLHNLTQLLCNLSGGLSQRERLSRINVEEDANKDNRQDHVQLLLRKDTLGVLLRLERKVEHPRDKVRVCNVTHVTHDINLLLARERVRLFIQKHLGRCRVERLNRVAPGIIVQQTTHALALLCVQRCVTRQHEATTTLAHEVLEALLPADTVLGLVFQDVLSRLVAHDIDACGCGCRTAEVETIHALQVGENLVVLCGDDHGVVGVDRVTLEVLRECTQEELIEDAAMVDVEVVVNLLVTPVGQVAGMVVNSVVPVTTNKSHSIREDHSGDCILSYALRPKCFRNSFRPAKFHLRPRMMPSISMGFIIRGTLRPPKAPPGCSIAVASASTSSSSLNLPSGPLLKPPKVRSEGSSATVASNALRALIMVCSAALRKVLGADRDTHLLARIKSPSRVNTVQVDNVAHVVDESDVDVQSTRDQSGGLEQLLITLLPRGSSSPSVEMSARLAEATTFVDVGEVSRDVIVETVEHDEDDGNTGRVADETLVSEAIGLELAILECSDRVAVFHG